MAKKMNRKNWQKGISATAITLAMAGAAFSIPAFAGDTEPAVDPANVPTTTTQPETLGINATVPDSSQILEQDKPDTGDYDLEAPENPGDFTGELPDTEVPEFEGGEKPVFDEEKPGEPPVQPEEPDKPSFDETAPVQPDVDGMEIDDANDLINDYNDNANAYNSALEAYKQQIADYEQDIADYNSKVESFNESSAAYAQDVAEYQAAVDAYEKAVADYNAKVTEYNSALDTYRNQAEEYNELAEDYNAKLDAYETELNKYKAEIDRYNKAVNDWNAKIKSYNGSVTDWNTAVSGSAEETEQENDGTISDNNSTVGGNNDTLEGLKGQIGDFTGTAPSENPDLTKEDDLYNLEDYDESVNNYNRQVDNYNDAVDDFNGKIIDHNQSQTDGAITKAENNNASTESDNSAKTDFNDTVAASNDTKITENGGDLAFTGTAPVFDAVAPEKPNLSNCTTVEQLQQAINDYNAAVDAYNAELAEYNQAVDAYNQAVDGYNDGLEDLEQSDIPLEVNIPEPLKRYDYNKWCEKEAQFYIRINGDIQFEDGTTQYDAEDYFRVDDPNIQGDGTVRKDDYEAYVKGTDDLIKGNQVNVDELEDRVHNFNPEDGYQAELENVFNDIYASVNDDPQDTNLGYVYEQIEDNLGTNIANRYANGDLAILWYVVKNSDFDGHGRPTSIHVDGVLYNVQTGTIISKSELQKLQQLESDNILQKAKSVTLIEETLDTLEQLDNLGSDIVYYDYEDYMELYPETALTVPDNISTINLENLPGKLSLVTYSPDEIEGYEAITLVTLESDLTAPDPVELMDLLEEEPVYEPEDPVDPPVYEPEVPIDTPVIEDEDTPLVETPDEEVTEDEETPLTETPDEEVIEDEETPLVEAPAEETIEDEVTPLAAVPQTGVTGSAGAAALPFMAAAAAITAFFKRRRHND